MYSLGSMRFSFPQAFRNHRWHHSGAGGIAAAATQRTRNWHGPEVGRKAPELQSQHMSTHSRQLKNTIERERTCSQTAHICYWLAEKQRAETIVTHCGDAVWRPERAKWNSSSIPQQKVWHKRFILQTAKIFEPITGGKWICLWRIKIWSTYRPHSKLHLWILTLNPWIYNHA